MLAAITKYAKDRDLKDFNIDLFEDIVNEAVIDYAKEPDVMIKLQLFQHTLVKFSLITL